MLDAMWRIQLEEHQQLLRAGLPASVGFVGLAAIMAITDRDFFCYPVQFSRWRAPGINKSW
jgi:hypothetical protein